MIDLFAGKATDARQLEEDPDTGVKNFRYIRTGEDHFSLAITYAWLGVSDFSGHRSLMISMRKEAARVRGELKS